MYGVYFGGDGNVLVLTAVIVGHGCEYIKTINLYILKCECIWYVPYISIKVLFIFGKEQRTDFNNVENDLSLGLTRSGGGGCAVGWGRVGSSGGNESNGATSSSP